MEIDNAVEYFEVFEQINYLSISDKDILTTMNEDTLLWSIQPRSLQTSNFITLGKNFDEKKDTNSVHRLIAKTIKHVEFFSRDALVSRKCEGRHKPDWLDEFMLTVWEPNI
jgi:hypothetical protein